MKLRFLCATHREQLSHKPQQAIHCWQNGFDTGQFLYEQQLWQDALPHLGCAFETSEILMTIKAIDLHCAYEIFASSTIQLADTFAKLGYIQQSCEVYCMAIDRLIRELESQPDYEKWIEEFIRELYQNQMTNDQNAQSAPLRNRNQVTIH